MSLSKLEVQRIMERLGKLESQVGGIAFKITAIEAILKPENLFRRVREGANEEKRKAEREQIMSGEALLVPKPPGTP
jgi:hypothetical protein